MESFQTVADSILAGKTGELSKEEISKEKCNKENIYLSGDGETEYNPVKETDTVESESRQVTEVTGISDKESDPQEES